MPKEIKKVGGSYLVVLPKPELEFYGWSENTPIEIIVKSNEIVLRKIKGIRIDHTRIEEIKKIEKEMKK